MSEPGEMTYRRVLLPPEPTIEDVRAVVPDYEAMLVTVMTAIADRYDRSTGYPYIDTKLDLITGEDFPDDDPIRGKNAVYTWIQGRGLEALAGHCLWMRRRGMGASLVPRLERMMREVLENLRGIKSRNGGHLFFFVTPEGDPFELDPDTKPRPLSLAPDSPFTPSDLFCAKGMYAAAHCLGEDEVKAEALACCLEVDRAIRNGTFRIDQQQLDPWNPVTPRPGYHRHSPYMLQIGAAALLAERGPEPESVDLGLRLIRYGLDNNVNLAGRIPDLAEYDFWEAVDDAGQPYREDGMVLSDPGHALECVGLILKFTAAVKVQDLANAAQADEIARAEALMPGILERNFTGRFLPGPGGICKAYDLVSNRPVNTDMPWWNLPETMRSAASCWRIAEADDDRRMCLRVLRDCHNAFAGHFVRPELHLMAYQTRSESGEPIHVIPATADADPGYHTGLSIIDMLDILEEA